MAPRIEVVVPPAKMAPVNPPDERGDQSTTVSVGGKEYTITRDPGQCIIKPPTGESIYLPCGASLKGVVAGQKDFTVIREDGVAFRVNPLWSSETLSGAKTPSEEAVTFFRGVENSLLRPSQRLESARALLAKKFPPQWAAAAFLILMGQLPSKSEEWREAQRAALALATTNTTEATRDLALLRSEVKLLRATARQLDLLLKGTERASEHIHTGPTGFVAGGAVRKISVLRCRVGYVTDSQVQEQIEEILRESDEEENKLREQLK